MVISELEKLVLEKVVDEINRNQKIPISLSNVKLNQVEENYYEGTIEVSEPRHVWNQSITVKIENGKATWQIDDHDPYTFEIGK